MPNPEQHPKPPSLADYFVYYDLPALLREAKADYSEAASGAPRLLNQQDIAARFRKARREAKTPHEPA